MSRIALTSLIALPATLLAQGGAEEQYQLAMADYSAGRLTTAEVHADSAVALDPRMANAYKLRGDIHQKNKDYEEALDDYERAEKLDPTNARLYVSRSAARITKGNIKGALKDLDKALALTPDDPDIYYNRACANYINGDNKSALRDANQALKLKNDHAEAMYLGGVIKGEEYREEEGLRDVQAALALKPGLPDGLMNSAILLFELERFNEAIERFTEVIATDTSALRDAYYYRGDCHYNLGEKELACTDWTKAGEMGDKHAVFIRKNYCETDRKTIPKKPVHKRRMSVVQF